MLARNWSRLWARRYVKTIQNKHGVEIGGFAVDETGKRVVM